MKTNNLKIKSKYRIIKDFRKMQKNINLKCYDCMGGQKRIDCEMADCSLFAYRPWSKTAKISKKNNLK